MNDTSLPPALLGAAAGTAGSVIQSVIGKTEEKMFLPPGEDSNIAPRLVARLAHSAAWNPSPATKWILGTAFHLGYGACWGTLYAMARERRPVSPLIGGALMGGLIYTITFPRWGGAVRTGTERPPGRRSRRMTFVDASVAVGFGWATAYVYEQLKSIDFSRSDEVERP